MAFNGDTKVDCHFVKRFIRRVVSTMDRQTDSGMIKAPRSVQDHAAELGSLLIGLRRRGCFLSHDWWVFHSGPASEMEMEISTDVTGWGGGPH